VDEGVIDTVKDVGKKVIKKTKEFINKPIIRDYPTKKEYEDSVKSGTSSKYESIEYKSVDEGVMDNMEPIPGKPGRIRRKPDATLKPVPMPNPPKKPGAAEPVPMPQPNFRKPPERKIMPLRPGDKAERKIMPLKPGDKPTRKPMSDHYDWRAELEEDWQKTNRQDKTDGMSQKAVNAYKRENPGSKLKTAVTKKPSSLKRGSKDAKRRKSFCSRMKGMKKRLTSAKTARDPDSRINKALRRWNC
jgi:hypothetical protein